MEERARHTLQDLFQEWGADQPTRLTELMNAEIETLDDRAKALRRLAVELAHSHERKPVYTAGHARQMLENHHLPSPRGKWCVVALDSNRERIYVRAEGRAMRLSHAVTGKTPVAEQMSKKVPLPAKGKYLVIYGGGPDILARGETATEIARFRREVPVADIIFWEETDTAATFYSMGVGVGQRGSEQVEFPDPALLERAREA